VPAHPWIFKGEVADASAVEPGAEVTVVDATGRFVGRGYYNPRPGLCCRILTWRDEALDAAFLERRLADAVARRASSEASGPPSLGRLVWSEADGLPGLVVDRYDSVLVVQCGTLGMARRRREIEAALGRVLGELAVFNKDEDGPAQLEGFEPAHGWAGRAGPATVEVDEGGVRFTVTLGAGHKTGLYLDQSQNHRRAAGLAADRDVLDAFCYTGGFACHALRGGARRAVLIDSSLEALAAARQNLALNGVAERAELVAANVFDELRRLERAGARFGLVVLDPPLRAESDPARRRGARLQGDQPPRDAAPRSRGGPSHVLVLAPRAPGALRGALPRRRGRRGGITPARRPALPGERPSGHSHDPRNPLPEGLAPRSAVTDRRAGRRRSLSKPVASGG